MSSPRSPLVEISTKNLPPASETPKSGKTNLWDAGRVSVHNLWSLGTGLTNRLQSMVVAQRESDLEVCASSSSSQADINLVIARVLQLNHLGYLRMRETIEMGRAELRQLGESMKEQQAEVHTLRCEVDVHKRDGEQMRASLASHKKLLEDSIKKRREESKRQEAAMAEQRHMIERLVNRRVDRDGVVDVVLLVSSWFAVNTTLVDVPLRLTLAPLPSHRARKWSRQLLKLFAVLALLRWMRALAQASGVHSSVGTVPSYFGRLFGWALSQTSRIIRHRPLDDMPTPNADHEDSFLSPRPASPPCRMEPKRLHFASPLRAEETKIE